ncbi:hypothetical protein [Microbacterium azadirachtae]|uniref:hypothetical protein n=1 Tax=Microbacterium azadirachtae TaxID=582680 RepID=UPI003F74D30A
MTGTPSLGETPGRAVYYARIPFSPKVAHTSEPSPCHAAGTPLAGVATQYTSKAAA